MPAMSDAMRAEVAGALQTSADAIVDLFGELLEADIPMAIVIDQLITYGALASVESIGDQATAAQFRAFADKIEAGYFHNRGRGN